MINIKHNTNKKYNTIWDKVSADIKKEFDSEPVYNKNYLKTKMAMKLQIFMIKKFPKIFYIDDSYYGQVFLKECKYILKKVVRHIHDSLSDFFYSSDGSDEE